MNALVEVDGGICGFRTQIRASSEDDQHVVFELTSDCVKVRKLGEALAAAGPVDGYAEIGAGEEGVVLTTSHDALAGCCAGCAVHCGVFKAMQVAAGLALPRDVSIRISKQ